MYKKVVEGRLVDVVGSEFKYSKVKPREGSTFHEEWAFFAEAIMTFYTKDGVTLVKKVSVQSLGEDNYILILELLDDSIRKHFLQVRDTENGTSYPLVTREEIKE